MSIVHKVSLSWSSPGTTQNVQGSASTSGDTEVNGEYAAPNGVTDYFVNIPNSYIRAAYLVAGSDIHVNTNNDGSPVDQIDLFANVPYVFQNGLIGTTPFPNGDVTRIFFHNSGADTTVKIRILLNTLDD